MYRRGTLRIIVTTVAWPCLVLQLWMASALQAMKVPGIKLKQEPVVSGPLKDIQGRVSEEEERWISLPITEAWELFKRKQGKRFLSQAKEEVRRKIFGENLKLIKEHNAKNARGEIGFTLAINEYADLSPDEFGIRNGQMEEEATRDPETTDYAAANTMATTYDPTKQIQQISPLPATVDWRSKGCVTPVKNQLTCGSCWAFSVTGALEALKCLASGSLTSFSEQNLVDCSTGFGNLGCNGGSAIYAYNYLKARPGIDTTDAYPYAGVDGACRYNSSAVGATISGYVWLPFGDEEAMRRAVATIGPIAASMDGSQPSLQLYSGGIYFDPLCRVGHNHGIVIVGYGTHNGTDFWIAKNSWGSEWGVNGYFYLARNKNNHCGIATLSTYPKIS